MVEGKEEIVNTIIKLIKLDEEYDLLSSNLCTELENEHRRIVRL